jgi:hypothetical protein
MPVALLMTVLLDLMELHKMERVEPEKLDRLLEAVETAPPYEEAERWDGLS